MQKNQKFFIGVGGWFIIAILGFIVILALGEYIFNFHAMIIKGGWPIFFILIIAVLEAIPFIIYQLANLHIAIEDNEIVLPQQYNLGLTSMMGVEPVLALFRKRAVLKISDILACDIETGIVPRGAYGRKGLRAAAQPLTITLKDGAKSGVNLKAYNRRTVINLLKSLKEINPQINFSERCEKMMSC